MQHLYKLPHNKEVEFQRQHTITSNTNKSKWCAVKLKKKLTNQNNKTMKKLTSNQAENVILVMYIVFIALILTLIFTPI